MWDEIVVLVHSSCDLSLSSLTEVMKVDANEVASFSLVSERSRQAGL